MGKFKFLIAFLIFKANAQSELKGVVKDDKNNPVISASVILRDSTGKIISFTYTNNLGNFVIHTIRPGKFQLTANSIGFEPKSVDVFITEKINQEFSLILNPKNFELKEVIVTSSRPIIVVGDTIRFNVSSFLQGNEQTVEDLLKKIPGLNIDANGTIKVGNQEIEKVMVDGEDLFDRGYKILTKNMPISPVEKVELLQRYSNNKHLKGIENSEKVALNLTLKEDAKRVWFGNTFAGIGLFSGNRYEGKMNVMNFGVRNKFYFLGDLNNIGLDAIGELDNLIRPSRINEPGSIGDNKTVNNIISLSPDLPNFKNQRINLNKAKMLSLNSIFTISKKVKLKAIGFINGDEKSYFRNSNQSFSVGKTIFENTEDFVGKNIDFTGFGKFDLTYDISKTKTFEYIGKLNNSQIENQNDLKFNGDLLQEKLNTNNQLIDQKVVYTNRFNNSSVLISSIRYINEKTPQNYGVNQNYFNDLFTEKANQMKQFSENKMVFSGIEAHLLDKKQNGDLLELKFGDQLRIDELNTRFELVDNQNNINSPNGYQNNLTYITNDLYFAIKYQLKLKEFALSTQADAHQLFNQLENFNVKAKQYPFFIVPKIGFDWKMNDKNKFKSSYSYNTTNAGILDVYSGGVQTSYRSILKGLEEFNQLNSSNAFLNYAYGNWGEKVSANTFILFTRNNDFYSTNSIISQKYSQSEKIVIKNRQFLTITSTIDYYLKSINSNLKFNLGATQINYKNIVNNSNLREIKNLNVDYGFELRSVFNGFFNFHYGSKWNYIEVETVIKNNYTNNMIFLDLSLRFNDKFNIQIQSERYLFGNLDKAYSKYYFLDLESRYIVKENKLTFFLSGKNLFNTEIFRNYSISDINTSQTEYKLMPKYVILKMEYRF